MQRYARTQVPSGENGTNSIVFLLRDFDSIIFPGDFEVWIDFKSFQSEELELIFLCLGGACPNNRSRLVLNKKFISLMSVALRRLPS